MALQVDPAADEDHALIFQVFALLCVSGAALGE